VCTASQPHLFSPSSCVHVSIFICMFTILPGKHMAFDCHFDHGFNSGVVSAGATIIFVDGLGCYLRVPLL